MRHFIITYTIYSTSGVITGNISIDMDGFPNEKRIKKLLIESSPDLKIDSLIITNIIELSDNDYEDWVAKPDNNTNND